MSCWQSLRQVSSNCHFPWLPWQSMANLQQENSEEEGTNGRKERRNIWVPRAVFLSDFMAWPEQCGFLSSDSPGMSGSRVRPESQAMGISMASGGRGKTVRVRARVYERRREEQGSQPGVWKESRRHSITAASGMLASLSSFPALVGKPQAPSHTHTCRHRDKHIHT